jgi:hypothetical protein
VNDLFGLCGPEPHIHHAFGVELIGGYAIVMDRRPVAFVGDATIAERVCELLDRHGLADVDDTPAALCGVWPPPDPLDCIIDYTPSEGA